MTHNAEHKVSIRKVGPGTILICDAGFTCIHGGAQRMVFRDKSEKGISAKIPWGSRSRLYVRCKDGRHYLDGQLDATGKYYVGFRLKGGRKS